MPSPSRKSGLRRPTTPASAPPRVTLRIDLSPTARIGPGKIRLLEAVASEGSISGAARTLRMSYRQAWKLLDELGAMFQTPLLDGHAGGPQGGGTSLTALGADVIRRYRELEQRAHEASGTHLKALARQLRQDAL